MASKTVAMKVEIEREIDQEIESWSDDEGRSKRRHVAIILRKLTQLRKSQPMELVKLGLLDRSTVAA